MDTEEINAPDLEDTEVVNAETELPDEQPEPEEGEGQTAEEDGPLVVSFGEDEPEAEPEGAAPEWVRELRKLTREQAKRIKELEQAQKANVAEPELGPEPTLEDYDYDPDAFKAAHRDWIKRSFEVEKEQESKREEERRQQEAFEQRVAEYNEAKAKLPVPDFDEAEAVLLEEFNPTQQGLLVKLAKQPALFAYALGKNPKGGLNAKGRASAKAQGMNLKPPVKKAEAAKSPKAAGRRKSFCGRMCGMKAKNTSSKTAREYLEKRKLNPEKFYFANKFKEWTNSQKQTFDTIGGDECRIIIPMYGKDNDLIGFQGRSLVPNSVKYITVMLDEEAPKIYGLNTIDEKLPVYVVEGPFDSTFVNNSVALCGSDGDVRCLEGSSIVFVYDNEPRNREIVNRISKCISRGESVVIWPSGIVDKDINDMVTLSDGQYVQVRKINSPTEIVLATSLSANVY